MSRKNIIICFFVAMFVSAAWTVFGNGNALAILDNDGGAVQYIGKHDIKNSPYFTAVDVYNLQSNDHLTVLSHFPTLQQEKSYSCGPSCAMMVEKYFCGKASHTEAEIVKIMGTSTTKGTTVKGMKKYFQQLDWTIKSSGTDKSPQSYEEFCDFVRNSLGAGKPIIVENVDWGGHWRVIIGFDTMGTKHGGDDVILLADPFDTSDHYQDGYNIASAERFFYMWFDHQLFEKGSQDKQWLIVCPKK